MCVYEYECDYEYEEENEVSWVVRLPWSVQFRNALCHNHAETLLSLVQAFILFYFFPFDSHWPHTAPDTPASLSWVSSLSPQHNGVLVGQHPVVLGPGSWVC